MALAHNISLKSSSWSQNRLLTYKKASRWKKTKKYGYKMPVIRALQYMPVSIREGTALTNCVCGTPFRTTCNKILARGTYPWYSMYTRKKKVLRRRTKRKGTEKKKKEKETRRKEKKWEMKQKTKHALKAQAESRRDKVAVCWHDQSSYGGPTEGRSKKTRRKTRQGPGHRAKKTFFCVCAAITIINRWSAG